jgi:hypothetical protein
VALPAVDAASPDVNAHDVLRGPTSRGLVCFWLLAPSWRIEHL